MIIRFLTSIIVTPLSPARDWSAYKYQIHSKAHYLATDMFCFFVYKDAFNLINCLASASLRMLFEIIFLPFNAECESALESDQSTIYCEISED